MLNFEWDPKKAQANLEKHGVAFEEATTVFGDPLSLTIGDPDHSEGEERFILLGQAITNRLIVVVHIEQHDRIRIISARMATKQESRTYEEG